MKIKTSELGGSNLDWAVAVAIGAHGQETGSKSIKDCKHWVVPGFEPMRWDDWTPSTDWSQGGPLITNHQVNLHTPQTSDDCWAAWVTIRGKDFCHGGRRPLIAACRAIVASKLGDEVDIPEDMV